jgi:hypothetical protein
LGQSLDIQTDDTQLQNCLTLLQEPHQGLVSANIGAFGIYAVRLNLHYDDTVSIFVDGPYFDSSRNQSAAIWLDKQDLQNLLAEALSRSE